MPPALRDLQTAFAAYLAGADRADLLSVVADGTIPAAARLRVYRHHVSHSLAAALAATFPTVQALVGETFFGAQARAFVAGAPPTQPVLAEYGSDFPAFVGTYEPARALPYLADMARLDWALNVAFHSPVGARLTAADLASVSTGRMLALKVALAPGTALVRSPYPIDRIWRASQPGATNDPVDLGVGGSSLLVLRRSDDAAFVTLSEPEAAFLAALDTDRTLEEATRAAFEAGNAFELSSSFARLLALEAFAALRYNASG
jgi:hypothetical protein